MIRKKPNMIRKKKKVKDVYKYLAFFFFHGEIQKVLVEKEGKKEALVSILTEYSKKPLSKIIKKDTKEHKLCNTLKGAKKALIKYQMEEVKYYKSELIALNKHIRQTKQLNESNL